MLKTETGVATFCKELCCKVGCIVISVEYRLAPEFQYVFIIILNYFYLF